MVSAPHASVATLEGVGHAYGTVQALRSVSLRVPAGCRVGIIGPDGVGKSTLLALLAGARRIQQGQVHVLGQDMARAAVRRAVCPRIAYMPQGLGRNLYPTLSVHENLAFFGSLFGHEGRALQVRMTELLGSTGLLDFADRPAGQLSGGMKQKLGLCCALIHDPDLLMLDEPTTGVDPLSRRQFWDLIDRIRARRPGMSVIVATAYMEEASRFDHLVAMDDGAVLAEGSPQALLERTATRTLEDAFIALLPSARRAGHQTLVVPPLDVREREVAIEARDLTVRFGDFTAVDRVSLQIPRGEIFGFLGSNGCGKTTTMKVLTGLLAAQEGQARLLGRPVDAQDLSVRRRVGYMTQAFSLYGELTVRQNLMLHARLFQMPPAQCEARVDDMLCRFDLQEQADAFPEALSLGLRQRLSLAVALVHGPDVLILDEPTSGVDPVARDRFWEMLVKLSREEGVTLFISTHFMNEALRCDRISLMHAGRILDSGPPAELVARHGHATLDDTFVALLQKAADDDVRRHPGNVEAAGRHAPDLEQPGDVATAPVRRFSLHRLLRQAHREMLELRRDPIRLTLALVGSLVLMVIMAYGISMDVKDLRFAVLDRDQSADSRDYVLNLAGSPYFLQQSPLQDDADLDRRMRRGDIGVALEIPPGFSADLRRGRPVRIGVWVDGAMPQRAETMAAYVQGLHAAWLAQRMADAGLPQPLAATLEVRFRYNPDNASIHAMVPAMIALMLMFIPAMLTALGVVREKEMGSIINVHVTPVTRLEFLLGKQLPYIGAAMVSFYLMTALAVWGFGVPLKGSLAMLSVGALLYVTAATGFGLLMSTFMKSQIAAIFGTSLGTMLPAISFSGMITPVSSLEGGAALMGRIYPTAHFMLISRGTFSKALGFAELWPSLLPLLAAMVVLTAASVWLMPGQEA